MKRLASILAVVVFALAIGAAALPCAAGDAPTNVYRVSARLPQTLHRIAVLPVTVSEGGLTAEIGRDDLEPVLYGELQKANLSEIVVISRRQLEDLTGKREWAANEELPPGLLETLRTATACDAVLFCRLTHFKPYAPLAVGWNLQLVDNSREKTLWAVDEVFDAANGATACAARQYDAEHFVAVDPPPAFNPFHLFTTTGNAWSILESPRRFAQYTASAVFATLPSR